MIAIKEKILENTIQLFYSDGLKELGSGVLFENNGRYFILTASHLFWGNGEIIPLDDIALIAEKYVYTIRGEAKYSNPKTNNTISRRDDDEYDIAVIELDTNIAEKVKIEYKFIGIDNIYGNHLFLNTGQYSIEGYPSYRASINSQKEEIKTTIFKGYTTLISQARFEKTKLNNHQVGLERLKVISSKTKNKAPKFKFNGISGGGLWFTPINKSEKYLVGIMVYDEKRFNILIATKIDLVIELLRKDFNIEEMPKTNIFNVII